MAARKTLGTLAIAAALAAGALGLSGCGSGSDADGGASSTPSPTPSQSVSAEVSGDKGSAKTGTNLDLPADWPAQLPMPAGAAANNVVDTNAGAVVSAATTYTSVQDCITAFQDAWDSDGVTITDVVSTSLAGGLKAKLDDGRTASLAVTMTGDTATAAITLS